MVFMLLWVSRRTEDDAFRWCTASKSYGQNNPARVDVRAVETPEIHAKLKHGGCPKQHILRITAGCNDVVSVSTQVMGDVAQ